MNASVDFGMIVGALRYAEKGIKLGQQNFECAAFAQNFNHSARIFLHQAFGQLLPDAFGNQGIYFAVFYHFPHQRHGFIGNLKTIARGKTGNTQNPHGVFGKGRRNMAQDAGCQILLSAKRIDDCAVWILSHGINGQVAAHQVLFQRNVFIGMKAKSGITFGGFALGTGKGVFFVAVWMEKDGKILANRLIALSQHGLRICTDDYPIAVFDGQA